MKFFFFFLFVLWFGHLSAQDHYTDSVQKYIKDYVKEHEVIKGDEKKYFHFFPIDKNYRVIAQFQKATNANWFLIETSGIERKMYRVYGTVSFTINDTAVKLNLYQAQNLLSDSKYKNYLALLFTDKTTGNDTYEAGRYVDLSIDDIKNGQIVIDFNKAYNPYCAYVKNRYNCPIPPRENDLPVAIRAGEKTYTGKNSD